MPKFLDNILSEPAELLRSLEYTLGEGRSALDQAAALVKDARHIVITGIGSSWHAGMAVESRFAAQGKLVHLVDASELLHFSPLPAGSVVLMLSRSGKSVEIVRLLDKAAAANVPVIALTNTPVSPLAQGAKVVLSMEAAFDHNVSVTMYSGLTLVGGLLAAKVAGVMDERLERGLAEMLETVKKSVAGWQQKVEKSAWFEPALPTYFLARGGSLASCHEARLLWEEAAKAPATAMTTGGFRHGPQEIIAGGARVGLWLDQRVLREQDLSLVKDLESRGVKVLLIGQDLPDDAASLVLSLPKLPAACAGWQFLTDIIPVQLATYRMARLRHADSDNFLLCPYVITTEGGLETKAE